MNWVQAFILGIRQIRAEMDISPGRKLDVLLQGGIDTDRQRYDANRGYIQTLARLESVRWLDAGEEAPESATALVERLIILVPMAGLIDKEAEIARLEKGLGKARGEAERLGAKLSNAQFVERAPAHVVEKERARMSALEESMGQLQEQLERIRGL